MKFKLSFGKHHWIALVMVVALLVLFVPYFSDSRFSHFHFDRLMVVPELPKLHFKADDIKPVEKMSIVKSASKNANAALSYQRAWFIQLATYQDESLAKSKLMQLRKDGYHAYLNPRSDGMQVLYVGPEISEADANSLKIKLDSDEHVNGLIVPFDPFFILSSTKSTASAR